MRFIGSGGKCRTTALRGVGNPVLEILKVIVNSNKIKVYPNEGPVDAILVEGLKFVPTRQLKWSEIKEPQLVKNSAAFKNFVKR